MRIEVRSDHILIDGYVNAVGRESRVLTDSVKGQFVEQIVPKTFEKALLGAENVDLLFNHNEARNLGSTKSGNLQLYEDNIGLRAIAKVSDTEVMKEARANKLTGWSFKFTDNAPDWQSGDGMQKRYLRDINLLEVSILNVTPAYIATSIECRGEESTVTEERGFEAKAEMSMVCKDCGMDMNADQPCSCGCTESIPETEYTPKKEGRNLDTSFFYTKEIEILKLKGGNH